LPFADSAIASMRALLCQRSCQSGTPWPNADFAASVARVCPSLLTRSVLAALASNAS
jgi:hypothetical protein